MSSLNLYIEKFNGNNSFSLWQIKMKSLLKQQGIWAPLSGKQNTRISEAQWEAMEEKAHASIMLCLSDDVITEVASEDTAASLWLKLESLYMTKSLTSKLLLKQRLFGLRMQEGTPLREHLDRLNAILLDLRNLEVKVEDEDAALILLVSLPLSYENFVQSFVGGKDTVTLEEVRSALHTRELRHQASGMVPVSDDVGEGLVVSKKVGKWKKKPYKTKMNSPCHICKKLGHWKNDCPELQASTSRKEEKQHATFALENEESEDDMALIAHDGVQQEEGWILDSAASYHMCPHKEWFSTYEEGGSTITTASGETCEVEGIGSVKVRTNSGKVLKLCQVRHVPKLKNNLISLLEVTKKGCRFYGRGDGMSVWKGALEVLRGRKRGNLYVVGGTTVVGSSLGSLGNEKKVELGKKSMEGIDGRLGSR